MALKLVKKPSKKANEESKKKGQHEKGGQNTLFRLGKSEKTWSFAQELTSHGIGILQDEIEVVTRNSFDEFFPRMKKNAMILIERDNELLSRAQEKKLKQAIKEDNLVVLMQDCEAGDLSNYATLSPKGKYVLVSNPQKNTEKVVVVDYGCQDQCLSRPLSECDEDTPSLEKAVYTRNNITAAFIQG